MTPAPLPPSALYRHCELDQLGIETTAELEIDDGLIVQERAIEAIQFGIGIHHAGYNLFALGPSGTGKRALIHSVLQTRARQEPVPPDWCYVFNFSDAHRPRALRLPPGKGAVLKRDMDQLVEDLHRAIQGVFESDEYRTRTQAVEEELEERQEKTMGEIRELAKQKDVILLQTPTGFTLAPVRDGKPLGPNEFHALPQEERARIEQDIDSLQAEMRKALHQMPLWKKHSDEQIEALNREMASAAIQGPIETLAQKYAELAAVLDYLSQVQADVVEHFRQFLPNQDKPQPLMGLWIQPGAEGPPWHHRYRVNVILGHDEDGGAPVVYADLPAHHQLVGRIEHRAHLGALETDFTMIRAGVLHQANGGYLILDALKLLLQPFAYETLKRLIQAGEIRIESLAQITSLISTLSLEPEPIPLDVKVVLIGERHLYYLLCELDPEFGELFKVAVDFDDRLERDGASQRVYARFIAAEVRRAGLRHFDRAAIGRIIEQSARLADDNERLTSHMRSIGDLVRESDYWAGVAGRAIVGSLDVQRAIDAQIERADRISRRLREETRRGTILIETQARASARSTDSPSCSSGAMPSVIPAASPHGCGSARARSSTSSARSSSAVPSIPRASSSSRASSPDAMPWTTHSRSRPVWCSSNPMAASRATVPPRPSSMPCSPRSPSCRSTSHSRSPARSISLARSRPSAGSTKRSRASSTPASRAAPCKDKVS